jgi:hypothetical protein
MMWRERIALLKPATHTPATLVAAVATHASQQRPATAASGLAGLGGGGFMDSMV